MNVRTIVTTALLAVSTVGAALPASAASLPQRHRRQGKRIHQGVRSGRLTWNEAWRLQRQESRMRRRVHHARMTGHRLSWRERVRLQHAENVESRKIYRQKHDAQHR